MAKGKKEYYYQVSNFADEILKRCKPTSCKLYFHLHFLESRLTGKNKDYFFRSIKQLCKDTNMSYRTVFQALQELAWRRLIDTWQGPIKIENERRLHDRQGHITYISIKDLKQILLSISNELRINSTEYNNIQLKEIVLKKLSFLFKEKKGNFEKLDINTKQWYYNFLEDVDMYSEFLRKKDQKKPNLILLKTEDLEKIED